jgi:hypothetical protein
MPVSVLIAMFLECLMQGFIDDPLRCRMWLALAVLCRIGFFGLLRPDEVAKLRRRDVAFPHEILFGMTGQMVVSIGKPKTARAFGRTQFVIIDDCITVSWAVWLFADLEPDEKLFPGSVLSLDKLFRTALAKLDLGGIGFGRASLRAGGATHFFRLGWSTEAIRFKGRWKNLATLEHYIQEGTSLLLGAKLSPFAQAAVTNRCNLYPNGPSPPSHGVHTFGR